MHGMVVRYQMKESRSYFASAVLKFDIDVGHTYWITLVEHNLASPLQKSSLPNGYFKHSLILPFPQYLNTPESQTLRCDLIRFIIGCIHPSNEVLCSDIIPRWAVIGWLLSSCTSPVATANSKLALFYDWLLYNTETDNIMNIGEPQN